MDINLLFFFLYFINIVKGHHDNCWSMNGVNNSVFVNDKCFQLFNQPLSWPEAQEFCSNYLSGGSLAEPVTPEEKNLAIQLVRSSSTGAWLGANNIISGSFVWSISQQRLSTLDNWWYIGEPNSYGSLKSCVQLAPTTGQIYDSHCIDKLLPMCHYAKDRETPINPCYPLKGAIYTNGTCLQLINVSKTWTDAQTSCSSVHPKAKLFEMFTEQERIEVTHYVQELGVSIFWIGGLDIKQNGQFVWATTPEVGIVSNIWNNGEPNNYGGNEDCVEMYTSGVLNDINCSVSRFALCELPQGKSGMCPSSGTHPILTFTDKCFVFLTSERLVAREARRVCESLNGTMAELLTEEERKAVHGSHLFNESLLLGVGDSDFEGEFVWYQNQSILRLNWWEHGQPDQTNINSYCVAMNSSSSRIADNSCNIKIPFVCQLAVPNPCDTILPGAIYSDGQCFKLYTQSSNWSQAQTSCYLNDSHLAEPKTQFMERAVNNYLRSMKLGTAWLGGQTVFTNRTFQWSMSQYLISSQHLFISNTSDNTKLAWSQTSEGIFYVDRTGVEMDSFICQTDAAPLNPQQYVAVLPDMSLDSLPFAYLQVTADNNSLVIYLHIQNVSDNILQESFQQLVDTRTTTLGMGSFWTPSNKYTYLRYVQVQSNQPVTSVLYIRTSSTSQVSATLILPDSIYTRSKHATSHIVYSTCQVCENIITILTKSSGLTNITFVYNDASTSLKSRPTVSTGQVQISHYVSTSVWTLSKSSALGFKARANIDGSYVFANQPVAVFLMTNMNTSSTLASTMDTLLPVDVLGSEYYTVPSIDGHFHYSIKIVAAYAWTSIVVYSPSEINTTFTLKSVGETHQSLHSSDFYYRIKGNTSFYAYVLSENNTCVTSLLPLSAWRSHYELSISPDLSSYTFYLQFVLPTEYQSVFLSQYFTLFNQTSSAGINGTADTTYTGLMAILNSPTNKYYHFQLPNRVKKFAAYVFGVNKNSFFCHPMGFSHTVEPSGNVFNHQSYVDKLLTQEPPVTCSTEEGTTNYPVDNTASTSLVFSDNTNITLNKSAASSITTSPIIPTLKYITDNATDSSTRARTNAALVSTTTKVHIDLDFSDLLIHFKTTSAYKRTLISVRDNRISAQILGGFGVIIMTSIFVFIFSNDLTYLRIVFSQSQ